MKYNRYRSEVVEGKCIPDSNVITFIRILSSRTVMIIRNCYNDRSIRCSCGVAALIQQATKSMVPPIFQMRVCWFPQKRNAIFQSFLPFFIPKIISYERFASTAPPSTSESACSMHRWRKGQMPRHRIIFFYPDPPRRVQINRVSS